MPDATLDDCGVCTLTGSVSGVVRATQVSCPVHGTERARTVATVGSWPLLNRGPEALEAILKHDREAARRSLRLLTPSELERLALDARQLAVLARAIRARLCCDMHNQHCEPPSELCCRRCPEAGHPEHQDGAVCVLPSPPVPIKEEGDTRG